MKVFQTNEARVLLLIAPALLQLLLIVGDRLTATGQGPRSDVSLDEAPAGVEPAKHLKLFEVSG